MKAIFITHLHSDHVAGVGEAAEQSWINDRPSPLTFIGPEGVDNLAEGFKPVDERDRVFRTAHQEKKGEDLRLPLHAAQIRSRIVDIPAPDGTALTLEDCELTITAIRVNHDPVSPASGFRRNFQLLDLHPGVTS